MPHIDRRGFAIAGLASVAFGGLALSGCAGATRGARAIGYGPLVEDPAGLLDLPAGFSYRVISQLGDRMDDGLFVPDHADGMGAFALPNGKVGLVRNHELAPRHAAKGPYRGTAPSMPVFDRGTDGNPLPGGTTTLVYDPRSGRVDRQHLSLAGTTTNCAGGTTPWGSWLTCEENVSRAGQNGMTLQDHGWVFEVPVAATGPVEPRPLRAMGRFMHEAATVDPRTGIVYLTEDRAEGLFYRFLPARPGRLAEGDRLQALAFAEAGIADTRNWTGATLPVGIDRAVRWIDLTATDSPDDDLRQRGAAAGAAVFARGEGVHFGRGELYFTCTSGGAAKLGQVMRYRPSRREGHAEERDAPGQLRLFVESADPAMLNYGDNLIVAPNGHLVVCEDQYTPVVDNHLRGITPDGRVYPLARLRIQTEPAGVCFAPDGRTMFMNVYRPAKTLAITGPWSRA